MTRNKGMYNINCEPSTSVQNNSLHVNRGICTESETEDESIKQHVIINSEQIIKSKRKQTKSSREKALEVGHEIRKRGGLQRELMFGGQGKQIQSEVRGTTSGVARGISGVRGSIREQRGWTSSSQRRTSDFSRANTSSNRQRSEKICNCSRHVWRTLRL